MQQPSVSTYTRQTRRSVWWLSFSAYLFLSACIMGALRSPFVWLVLVSLQAIFILRSIPKESFSTAHPGLLEKIMAWLSSLSMNAMAGVIVLLAHLLVTYLLAGILWLVQRIWPQAVIDPAVISGDIFSIVWLLATLASWSIPADRVARLLYPNVAGLRSAFYEDVTNRRRRTITRLVIGSGILLLWISFGVYRGWWDETVFMLITLFALFLFAPHTEPFDDRTKKIGVVSNINRAVANLLQKAGYQVMLYPRTGQPEIDPLLLEVDLYAVMKDHLLVVDMIGDMEKSSTNPATRSGDLLLAGMSLAEHLQKERPPGSPELEVEPLIMLVDLPLTDDWHRAAKRDGVKVSHIDSSVLTMNNELREAGLRAAFRQVKYAPQLIRKEGTP